MPRNFHDLGIPEGRKPLGIRQDGAFLPVFLLCCDDVSYFVCFTIEASVRVASP